MNKTIHKILIANRGEIAVRIIHTARRLGYRTVAVFSHADADALHVKEADQAVCIGPSTVAESYLMAEKILQAAVQSGADAIHPGYGFLSENPDFAKACEQQGLIFIGPDASAIELMGSKRLSKVAMLEAGVPCIPGYQDAAQDDQTLQAKALEIGFPLMVKASAGGGGRGMRLVLQQNQLAEQIKTARSEALNAFGSGELILEKAVLEPRHVEIQVFADDFGNAVYLGERDCSIQRRHQKVLEEAPSPFVDQALRQRMGKAAVDTALACDYRGAGTVEFLVDAEQNFYFLEMNTRLQVEHPVTELVTGLDLVEWQLRVAAGEPLPLQQEQITLQGHAIEVRLYAEDPRKDFMPQTGEISLWKLPLASNQDQTTIREGIRVDHGIQQGQTISSHYDPMLAKIIAFAETRSIAARKLASAVQDTQLLGVNNNKHFLANVLRHPVFLDGEVTTAFIEKHFDNDPSINQQQPAALTLARAALLFYQRGQQTTGWRSTAGSRYHFKLECEGQSHDVRLSQDDRHSPFNVTVAEHCFELKLVATEQANSVVFQQNGLRDRCYFTLQNDILSIDDGSGHFVLNNITQRPADSAGGAGGGQIKAVMDGAIVDVRVQVGDQVDVGQTLVVLDAMKIEHQLKANIAGQVSAVSVQVGQQVKTKQLLVSISVGE